VQNTLGGGAFHFKLTEHNRVSCGVELLKQ
jgi:hypothetical protein